MAVLYIHVYRQILSVWDVFVLFGFDDILSSLIISLKHSGPETGSRHLLCSVTTWWSGNHGWLKQARGVCETCEGSSKAKRSKSRSQCGPHQYYLKVLTKQICIHSMNSVPCIDQILLARLGFIN